MRISVAGTLPNAHRKALREAGVDVVGPDAAADAELVIAPRPPAELQRRLSRRGAARRHAKSSTATGAPWDSQPWLWGCPGAVSPDAAEAAAIAGAYDSLSLKLSSAEFAATLRRRMQELAARLMAGPPPEGFVARSAAAQRFLRELDRVAGTSMAVLLTGETGTGKDLAARHIHARSGRRGELVPINCAAIPNDLIEGELFGYARGAFSGAVQDYDGQLRAASGGTVFLDEVDDTPFTVQIKLLRVLEDHVISRLGENKWHRVDFRVVAATNRDLEELVRRGEFGADLFQRLAIVRIELPPLRERAEDLPDLCALLIARFYTEEPNAPHRVTSIAPAAERALARYAWPGNVRELRNVLYQALVGKRAGEEVLLSDLPARVIRGDSGATPTGLFDREALARRIAAGSLNLREVRDDLERAALELALAHANGSPTKAARLLGEVGRGASTDPGGTVRAMRKRLGV
ncbi:MAG TPA: sigma 54-interacting transcriptional regulator [Kofleriaceae bacterium]